MSAAGRIGGIEFVWLPVCFAAMHAFSCALNILPSIDVQQAVGFNVTAVDMRPSSLYSQYQWLHRVALAKIWKQSLEQVTLHLIWIYDGILMGLQLRRPPLFLTHVTLCSINLAGCRFLRFLELPSVEHLQDFVSSGVTVALDAPAHHSALRLSIQSGCMLGDRAAAFGFRYWGNISRDELNPSMFDM
jgi:hypothetical protein